MATKQYIAVDENSRVTGQQVKMTNVDNKFTGQLLSVNPNGGEAEDVRQLFLSEVKVNGQATTPEMVNGKRVVDIQIPGGTIESISLVGAEGTEIPATVENGHAEIRLEEIEVEELAVNKLYIHDKDIEDMIPDLSGARNLQDAETVDLEEGFDMDELAQKYNALVENFNSLLAIVKGAQS